MDIEKKPLYQSSSSYSDAVAYLQLKRRISCTADSSLHKACSFGSCVGRCVCYHLLHMSDCTEITVHGLLSSHLV